MWKSEPQLYLFGIDRIANNIYSNGWIGLLRDSIVCDCASFMSNFQGIDIGKMILLQSDFL